MSIDNLPPWISDPANLHVGQTVFHLGKPNDVWVVEKIAGNFAWVVQNKGRDESRCNLPVGSLAAVPTPALIEAAEAARIPAPRTPADPSKPAPEKAQRPVHVPPPRDVGDVISKLLSATPEVGPWRVLEMAACMDVTEVKAKIGHLGAGLQRMGIGNRLRNAWKAGKFDADALLERINKGER